VFKQGRAQPVTLRDYFSIKNRKQLAEHLAWCWEIAGTKQETVYVFFCSYD
jgi:hypothetical protein